MGPAQQRASLPTLLLAASIAVAAIIALPLTLVSGETPTPVTVSFNEPEYRVNEGGSVEISVSISADPDRRVAIPISFSPALESAYQLSPASVTFTPGGELTRSATLTVADNDRDEIYDVITLAFSTLPDGVTATNNRQAVVFIEDNDLTPLASINSPSVLEGNNDITTLRFTVSLSHPSERSPHLWYEVDKDASTGTWGADYYVDKVAGKLEFGSGETTKTIAISIYGNTRQEPNRTVVVALKGPLSNVAFSYEDGYLIRITGVGTIIDDDSPTFTPSPTPTRAHTPVQPTPMYTHTPTPTLTNTPTPTLTNTPTPTLTNTPTPTLTNTPTPTLTNTPTPTLTNTPTPTLTNTPTPTLTNTPTPTLTNTPTPTFTNTPTPTLTNTPTPTLTNTPTPTLTHTPTPTLTHTPTPTLTHTPTPTLTHTPTPTLTHTPTPTLTHTPTPTLTHTPTPTLTHTPTPTLTHTPTPTLTHTPTPVPPTLTSTHTSTPTPTALPRLDAEIIGIYAEPSGQVMQGTHVKVSVTVRNNGDYAVNIPVELTFPSKTKKPERRSPRTKPGETATATFTWKTRNYDAGIHTLRAALLVNDNATNGNMAAELTVRLIPLVPTASIVSIKASPADPVVGMPVTITVTVRNDGLISARIPVTLHFPSTDKQPETRRPYVLSGEATAVNFTWRTSRYAAGDHTFYVAVAGHAQPFIATLLPPTVDFTVLEIRSQGAEFPIVKGDWVEVSALVQNLGPYGGRADVSLHDMTANRVMYRKSAHLESGEREFVNFTWKTLRYATGDYQLQVSAKAEHDVDPSNNYSDYISLQVLTNRDITVGYGGDAPENIVSGDVSKPRIRSVPEHHQEIIAYDSVSVVGAELRPPAREGDFGAVSFPLVNKTRTPYQMAQTSAVRCAEYQRQIWESQPRAVLCPAAPPLVR